MDSYLNRNCISGLSGIKEINCTFIILYIYSLKSYFNHEVIIICIYFANVIKQLLVDI